MTIDQACSVWMSHIYFRFLLILSMILDMSRQQWGKQLKCYFRFDIPIGYFHSELQQWVFTWCPVLNFGFATIRLFKQAGDELCQAQFRLGITTPALKLGSLPFIYHAVQILPLMAYGNLVTRSSATTIVLIYISILIVFGWIILLRLSSTFKTLRSLYTLKNIEVFFHFPKKWGHVPLLLG